MGTHGRQCVGDYPSQFPGTSHLARVLHQANQGSIHFSALQMFRRFGFWHQHRSASTCPSYLGSRERRSGRADKNKTFASKSPRRRAQPSKGALNSTSSPSFRTSKENTQL